MRKCRLTLTGAVEQKYGHILTEEKINFLREFLVVQSPQKIWRTINVCHCGCDLLAIYSPKGKNQKGAFCPVCAFEDLAWPE